MPGVVAAGHPLTAEAGARVLREGGNAVDAALGAMLVSWVAEPLLCCWTSSWPPPARAREPPGELTRVDVSFTDATQSST